MIAFESCGNMGSSSEVITYVVAGTSVLVQVGRETGSVW